jgi:hypothetical protein
MKNYLIAAATAAVLIASAQTRAATVDIDFTFTNTVTGTVVEGEIDGLTVGGTSSASAIYINSYTNGTNTPYSFPTPILMMTSVTSDTFTLDASGAVTAAKFNGDGLFGSFSTFVNLSITRDEPSEDVGSVFQYIDTGSGPYVQTGGDFGQLDYEPVSATPLPATLPLFANGLGVIALLVRRRKRKAPALAV